MLDGMRRHANSFIMSLLFAIIIIVFVFSFGPGSARYCGQQMPQAATVNGHPILASDFQQEYARTFQQMSQYRRNYTTDTARAENLKQTVVDRLISRELLVQEALDRGIVITDEELAMSIMDSPYFQTDGKFDAELYSRYATSLNLSEASFEEDFRRDLTAQRMQEILLGTVTVSETEIKALWERRNNRVDLWVAKVDPFPFRRDVQVSDEQAAKFASDSRSHVEDYYNKHANRYNIPEKVRARHILIKVAEGASSEEVAKAKTRIEEVKALVDKGEDFASLAKQHSEDSSASQGGDLGTQGRGAWVKPFEEAAFALEPGAVSDIVRSKFGFHIIKTESKTEAVTRSVDDVAQEIAKSILVENGAKEKAKTVAAEWLEKLKTTEDPESLNPQEEEGAKPEPFAVKVESTGMFEKGQRYVPKAGVAPEIAEAAFALTKDKPTPDAPIEASNRLFAIKLKEREEADPEAYAEDREQLKTELLSQRQRGIVESFTKTLREKAEVNTNKAIVSYEAPEGEQEQTATQ